MTILLQILLCYWGVYGIKGGAKRITGYVATNAITKNKAWISKYKLFISKSYSADAIVPPEIILASPNVVCSETFLVIGSFDNQIEQQNANKYLKSNFFRILLFLREEQCRCHKKLKMEQCYGVSMTIDRITDGQVSFYGSYPLDDSGAALLKELSCIYGIHSKMSFVLFLYWILL